MKTRSFLNILLLSISFFFIYTATGTENQIQKVIVNSINLERPDLGWDAYQALCISYLVFAFGNFFVPSILTLISTKNCLFISSFVYLICSLVFFYPFKYALSIISFIQGFSASVLWCCQGKYLIENSNSDTIDRNTGLFWSIYEGGLVLGSLFFYFEFQGVEIIHQQQRFQTYLFLSIVFLIGCICFLFLQRSTTEITEIKDISLKDQINPLSAFRQCIRFFKTKEMIMISLATFYTGLEQSFFNSVYPTVIGYTKAFGNDSTKYIGSYGIVQGIGECIGGILFGCFGKKLIGNKRNKIYFLGISIHFCSFLLIFINHSSNSTFEPTEDFGIIKSRNWIAMLSGFFLGLGDACLSTQLVSLIGTFYTDPIDISSVYALYKFIHSIGAATTFFYSIFNLNLHIHIIILIIFLFISTYSYHLTSKLVLTNTFDPIV